MICRFCLETIEAHQNVSKMWVVCADCDAKIKRKAAYLKNKKRKSKLSNRRSKIKNPLEFWFNNPRILHKPFPGDEEAIIKLLRQVLKGNRRKRNLLSLDHIVPVKHEFVCGLSVSWNLQVLLSVENTEKGNRYDAKEQEIWIINWCKSKGL